MSMISKPIFLVGAERSGTTLLRLMLSHHPEISWCHEFEYVVDCIESKDKFPPIGDYLNYLSTNRIFQATGFQVDQTYSYPQLVNSFLQQQKEQKRKPIIGATVHRHFDRLLYIWPDARFIHIIRDGRDVAKSCIGMGWAGNVWTGIQRWQAAEHLWEELAQQLPQDRHITIFYEDLIAKTEQVLSQLCQFIGVDYNAAMLSYPQNTTYSIPSQQYIEQWRKKLSQREIQLIESRISQQLQTAGYSLSEFPLIKLSLLEQLYLFIQDWWYRTNFRRKRYGNLLFVADFLSRRLPFHPGQRSIRQKINQINIQYLK